MSTGTPATVNTLDSRRDLADLRRVAGGKPSRESAAAVAKQFESLFVGMMLKSMRAATPDNSLFGSQATKQYQGMFDQQIAGQISQGRGLGLAPMIQRQILRQQGLDGDGQALDSSLAPYADRMPVRQVAPSAAVDSTEKSTVPSPASARREAVADSPEAFIKRIWPMAKRAAAKLDVSPKALVAQAALETGWGQHVLHGADGRSSNNLFNIKAGRGWDGRTVTVPTLEYRGDVPVRESADFRAYDSLQDAFDDYASFLRAHPRYAGAVGSGGDAAGFAHALQKAGYATDPRYAEKIQRILDGDHLSTAQPESLKNGAERSTT